MKYLKGEEQSQVRGDQGEAENFRAESIVDVQVVYSHIFPSFDNILWLYKMLTLGKAGRRHMGTLYSLSYSSMSLKLFQNKKEK